MKKAARLEPGPLFLSFRLELFLHHHGVSVDAEEDVPQVLPVQRGFHLVQLVLGELDKGLQFLR